MMPNGTVFPFELANGTRRPLCKYRCLFQQTWHRGFDHIGALFLTMGAGFGD